MAYTNSERVSVSAPVLSHAHTLKEVHGVLPLGEEQAIIRAGDRDAEEVEVAEIHHCNSS